MADKSTISVTETPFGYVVQYDHRIKANCTNRERFAWRVNNNTSIRIQVYLDNWEVAGQPVPCPLTPPVLSSGVIDRGKNGHISAQARECAYRENTIYTYDINITDEFGAPLPILHAYAISINREKVDFLGPIDPELELDL